MSVADREAASEPLRIHPFPADPRALKPFNEATPAWRETAERLDEIQPRLRKRFLAAANAAALATMTATGALALWAAPHWLPGASLLWAGVAVLAPAALLGLAAGHAAGGWAIRRATGLSPEGRRLFALRLGASRMPSRWPSWFGRWLFTGDWLAVPRLWEKAPYLRAFVTGRPGSESEELAWWEMIVQQLDGCGGLAKRPPWEAGATHFEMGYTDALPKWTRGLADGAGLANVAARTGPSTMSWARHFWRRATLRLAGLGDPEAMEEDAFAFYRVKLGDEREALVVTLRPAAVDEVSIEGVEILSLEDAAGRLSA